MNNPYFEIPVETTHIEAELCERKLAKFVEFAWPTVEPKEYHPSWHIDAVCEHLEAVTAGQIRNLIINIPPRHTKSLLASVMWPSWEWGPRNKPGTRWLCTSYGQSLSTRDSVKCRTVIQSPWYQERWGHRYFLMGDQNEKTRYNTNHGGYRLSSSVEGVSTGEGGDRILIDDAHNIKEIESSTSRQRVIDWWKYAMSTRLNDPRTGSRVIIMQRGHCGDLVGWILEEEPEEWEKLILPAEFEKKSRCVTSIGFKDPRKKEGELLCPGRFPKKELNAIKKTLGTYGASAQLQQRPTPLEGGIIKKAWFRFYPQRPEDIVDDMDFVFQSWDMAFKDLRDSDFVVGGVWGVKGALRFRLDESRDRLSFTETLKAVRSLTEKWPQAVAKYVEDKANGPAVIDALKSEITGLIAYNPEGSKESRVFAVSPEIEAGNLLLPLPKNASWVDAYIEELCVFNKGAHDDRVDETTQALIKAKERTKQQQDLASVVSMTKAPVYAGLSAPSSQTSFGRSKWQIGT